MVNPRVLLLSVLILGLTVFVGVFVWFYGFVLTEDGYSRIMVALVHGGTSGCACSGLWGACLLFLLILRKLSS